jgi:hypothetical protein
MQLQFWHFLKIIGPIVALFSSTRALPNNIPPAGVGLINFLCHKKVTKH